MENKQTAVEYLEDELAKNLKHIVLKKDYILMESLFEQAKQMEKEQTTEKTNTNNNIQTKTRWSDTERWIAAVIATLGTFGFIYWLYTIGYLIHFGIYTLLTWLVVMIVFLVKHLIDNLIDGR